MTLSNIDNFSSVLFLKTGSLKVAKLFETYAAFTLNGLTTTNEILVLRKRISQFENSNFMLNLYKPNIT